MSEEQEEMKLDNPSDLTEEQGESSLVDRKTVVLEGGPANGCEVQVRLDVQSMRVSVDDGVAIYKQSERRGDDGLVGEHWDFFKMQESDVLTFEQKMMFRFSEMEDRFENLADRTKEMYEGLVAFANVVGEVKMALKELNEKTKDFSPEKIDPYETLAQAEDAIRDELSKEKGEENENG